MTKPHRWASLTLVTALAACGDTPPVAPGEQALIALSPTEYNNTVRDLLGLSSDGSEWPAAPEIAGRFTAYDGAQAGLFGSEPVAESPWPWVLPEEEGVGGFEGLWEGQQPSAYKLEELQKAAVYFASYTLVAPSFFACADWAATQDEDCAWESLSRFAQRAWRRPLEDGERERLQTFWQQNVAQGTAEEALVLTAAGILQSPQFVFRIEHGQDPPEEDTEAAQGTSRPLTGWEMASRLSYFLWDSMPDATLFQAAADGGLDTEQGVRDQVQRMLQDPRAQDAVVHFHRQWLGTDDILTVSPDRSIYGPIYGLDPDPKLDTSGDEDWPEVLGPVRHSMDAEFHLFVRDVLFGEEATLGALFTADQGWASNHTTPLYGDYTPRDGEVERWPYGNVAASQGSESVLRLNPIVFPEGQRAGLLTLPAVLAVGAYAVHPAPIRRGHTLLDRVLCTDMGTPPPGAEASAPPDTEDAESTNRDRTATATSSSECTGCHDILNPPGFAYEHYDAMGIWRAQDNGQEVDASGSFTVQGETFLFSDGLALGEQLAASNQVRDCYSLHWSRYAIGEALDPDDERLAALQAAFRTHDHVPQLLEDIAASPLFRSLWLNEVTP